MNASVAIQVLPSVQDEEEVIRIVDERSLITSNPQD